MMPNAPLVEKNVISAFFVLHGREKTTTGNKLYKALKMLMSEILNVTLVTCLGYVDQSRLYKGCYACPLKIYFSCT